MAFMEDTEKSRLHALFTTGDFSDLTVVCGEHKLRLHKTILCVRSDFFYKACNSKFMEAQNGIITLNDEDPDRIKQFLQYLYVQDYDLLVTKLYPTDTDKVLLEHAEIYTLADRYGVPSLKKLASTRFKDCLPTEYASDKLSVEVIENVYASTVPQDRGLRAPLLDYLVRSTFHYDLLDDLYSTLESVDGLALELLCALWDYLHDDVGIRCTKCPDYSDSDIDVAARLTISDCGEHVTILCSRCGSGYDDMIVVFS